MEIAESVRLNSEKSFQTRGNLLGILVPSVEASSVFAEVVMVATGTTTGSSSLDSPGTTNTAGLRSHSHGGTSREQLVDRKRLLLVVASAKQVSGNPTRQHEDLFLVFLRYLVLQRLLLFSLKVPQL